MPWISVDLDVRDHPKTRRLSKLLQCSRHEAIGILVVLWQWGLTNATREGVISYASDEDIAMGIMITNKSPQQLVGALVESGWIDKSKSGEYTLHDWSEWQSMWYQAVDRRKSNAEAQKRIRMRKSDALKNIGVESLPIDSHADSHRDCHGDTCANNVKNAMDSGKTIPIV